MILFFRSGEILPLSIDHTIYNEDELLRLSHLGVDLKLGVSYPELGERSYTRSENYLCIIAQLSEVGFNDYSEWSN